jgi:sec-independent protein translocase protein TatA
MRFNGWEIVIVLAIILILFGPGRIGKIGGELGSSIKNFKDSLQGDDEEDSAQEPDQEES